MNRDNEFEQQPFYASLVEPGYVDNIAEGIRAAAIAEIGLYMTGEVHRFSSAHEITSQIQAIGSKLRTRDVQALLEQSGILEQRQQAAEQRMQALVMPSPEWSAFLAMIVSGTTVNTEGSRIVMTKHPKRTHIRDVFAGLGETLLGVPPVYGTWYFKKE